MATLEIQSVDGDYRTLDLADPVDIRRVDSNSDIIQLVAYDSTNVFVQLKEIVWFRLSPTVAVASPQPVFEAA